MAPWVHVGDYARLRDSQLGPAEAYPSCCVAVPARSADYRGFCRAHITALFSFVRATSSASRTRRRATPVPGVGGRCLG